MSRIEFQPFTTETTFSDTSTDEAASEATAASVVELPFVAGDGLETFLASTSMQSGLVKSRLQSSVPSQEVTQAAAQQGFDLDQIQGVRGNPNVTPEFKREVEAMARRLGTRPEYIMAVMSFESGGTFSPAKENTRSHATGLIQFMPATARGMLAEEGVRVTSSRAREIFAAMTPLEQLRYVEKYLGQRKFSGRLGSLEGVYTAVLSGQARQNPDDVVFGPGTNYNANSGLDWNSDGQITAAEATNPVAFRLFGGVADVQRRLRDLDYLQEKPDGRFGPRTRAAIEHFQRDHQLEATGLMNEATGRALGLGGGAETQQPPRTETEQPGATTDGSANAELRRGSNGPEVERLQDRLIAFGYMTEAQKATGPGIFGQRTENALKAFQRDNHLPQSGVYDPVTRGAFGQLEEGLRRGSRGDLVSGLQDRLVTLGYMTREQVATGPGIFGQRTENAVKAFQARNGLQQSGVLDVQTYRRLYSESARAQERVGNGGAGQHYTVNAGVRLSENARERIGQIADEYFQRTGKNLRITDGTRTAHDQAERLYDKIRANDTGIYTDQTSIAEIRRAYNAGVRARETRAQIVNRMAAVIQGQVDRGVYVSRHLRAGAVDVSVRNMTGADERAFRQSVAAVGGVSVLRETEPPHFHLQF